MTASLTPATPVLPLERTGTESLFKRLDTDGNGRLTVADRVSAVVILSPQGMARFAAAANQGRAAGPRTDEGQARAGEAGPAAARYQAVQALAA